MNTIKVNKADLIEKITANRDEHIGIVEAAQVKYRERVIEELDKRLEDARRGRKIDVRITLPVPENYTREYDNALAALEWEVDDEVELEQDDFNRLVLNQWSWVRQFAANTQSYLVTEA